MYGKGFEVDQVESNRLFINCKQMKGLAKWVAQGVGVEQRMGLIGLCKWVTLYGMGAQILGLNWGKGYCFDVHHVILKLAICKY